jgi:NDP-sugar pyrophosphorylase family protein
MVEINGKPFLEYQLELLADNDIHEAILCVGYLGEQIQEYFGDHYTNPKGRELELYYSVEPWLMGTAGAIRNAKKYIQDYFFLLNGDTYLTLDYQALASELKDLNVVGVTSIYDNRDKIIENNVKIGTNGQIMKYSRKLKGKGLNGVEAGVAVFNKRLLKYIPKKIQKDKQISMELDIYPKLIKKQQLYGYLTNIRFYDMGTEERIKIISEVLK